MTARRSLLHARHRARSASTATRKASPLEVMQAVLARIDARESGAQRVRARSRAEQALAGARKATAGARAGRRALPPLHGVPVSIKDLTPTKGIRTTWGSKIFEHHVPEEDALVGRAAEGGGRHRRRQDEHAGVRRRRQHVQRGLRRRRATRGTPRSPAAARAAAARWRSPPGMGPLAQGSDLGGSLRTARRRSAAWSASARRPGLVPRHPRALAWDTLSVTGPDGAHGRRHRADAVGASPAPTTARRSPMPSTRARSRGAVKAPSVKGLAHRVDAGSRRPHPGRRRGARASPTRRRRRLPLARRARRGRACPDFSEVERHRARHAAASRWWRATPSKLARSGRTRCRRASCGTSSRACALTAVGHRPRRDALRTELWQRVRAFMERYDLILLPTTSRAPVPRRAAVSDARSTASRCDNYIQWAFLTYGITLTGLPAISVPCGFTRERAAGGAADRRALARGGRGAPRRGRLRGGGALGRQDPARRHLTTAG